MMNLSGALQHYEYRIAGCLVGRHRPAQRAKLQVGKANHQYVRAIDQQASRSFW